MEMSAQRSEPKEPPNVQLTEHLDVQIVESGIGIARHSYSYVLPGFNGPVMRLTY